MPIPRRSFALLIPALFVAAIAGCVSKEPEEEELLILYPYQEQADSFYQTYVSPFTVKYPDVKVTVIYGNEKMAFTDQRYESLVDTEKPDVVILSDRQYGDLAGNNKLTELDPWIRKDGFDEDRLYPPLLSYLKSFGQGKLEGLSADFVSFGLYYNKELFQKYGVALPQAQSTWADVWRLAEQFAEAAKDDPPVYGLDNYDPLEQSNAFALVRQIGESQGLSMFDTLHSTFVVNDERWKPIFTDVIEGIRSGAIHPNALRTEAASPFQAPFLNGSAAMMVANSDMATFLDMLSKVDHSPAPKDWDIAAAPSDPANPDYGARLKTSVYAIPHASGSKDAAWKFIQFVHSDATMRILSKTNFRLQSRVDYTPPIGDKNVKAFYANPQANVIVPKRPDVPGLVDRINQMAVTHMQAAVDGSISVDQALDMIQKEGQLLWNDAAVRAETEPN